MNLNNKGWGLQELMVGLGILFFSLLLIVILINKNFKDLENTLYKKDDKTNQTQNRPSTSEENYSSYNEIEKIMIAAAKEYNNDIYGASLQEEDNLTVTVKSLVRDNYLEPITDIKDESITCSGYVTFIKKGVNVTYSPYLKCGTKYTTKGYLERLDAEV